jgi:Fe-S cluster assembly protein SufD
MPEMNMLKRVQALTPGEEAILEASARLVDGDPMRAAAANALRERGLPTRRVEAWHYTDLRGRLKSFPAPAEAGDAPVPEPVVEACRIAFSGGMIAGEQDKLPAGVAVESGAAAAGWRDGADAVGLLNSMLASGGVRIHVAPGARIEQPLALLHGGAGEVSRVLRHAVEVARGASVSVIEQHQSEGAGHANVVCGLTLEEDASVLWVIVQEEGQGATHLAQLNVTLGARSSLTVLMLNAGGGLVRREINVASRGAGAQLSIRGVNLVGDGAHLDVTTVISKEQPDCTADELIRNVATGNGAGIFQGMIKVHQIAQKTDARMACNTLLLSDEAEFLAKPELEIFADDVQGGHGATVADIDDDHLFYLMARGIPQAKARAMLVEAFVAEVFDAVEDEALREALDGRISTWLERNG